ncbi:hypothetical protein ACJ41O_000700 [Fusarium nematophilum]
MRQWLQKIGHSNNKTVEIDNLNIVHVAGTKGKGSTCAFIESFLRAFGKRTGFPRKTGLYTSPHLIYPEERIRIDFQPISRDLFAKYFFQVWDALSANVDDDNSNNDNGSSSLPRYLQLLALVSFHAFIREGVQAAVFETHHGGEYDATNVIEHPVATVITPLGMDHVDQLGPTIEHIAWHKAGIFKKGSPALSSQQEAAAAEVLRSRASERGVSSIQFVQEDDPCLPDDALQLNPDVQRANCSVALAAVRRFLRERTPEGLSPADVLQGISQFSWPGRFQHVAEGSFNWFLDGAHNEMSVCKAAEWFIESSQREHMATPPTRILIFSQVSGHRDSVVVLQRLAAALGTVHIHHAIFTLYDPKQDHDSAAKAALTTQRAAEEIAPPQRAFGEAWKALRQDSRVLYEPSIQQALDSARKLGAEAGGMQTLITAMSYFVYRALTPDERRIRLIQLQPRRTRAASNTPSTHGRPPSELTSAPVSCTISHVSLDQPPPYSALSYTWGDTSQKGSITVDEAPFTVTKSLEAALSHLAPDNEDEGPLTLWIDALCIDQDDEAEKTEQVAQMQQIYSRAASVITWLGPAADDSDAAMLWIQRYGSAAHGLGIGTTPELQLHPLLQALESDPGRLPSLQGLEEFLRDISVQLAPSSGGVVTALSRLFARPYWSRIWVVQEIVHGRRVRFLCGGMAVSEEQLHHSLRLLRNFGQHQNLKLVRHRDPDHSAAALTTLNPINILKVRRAAGPFPLVYLIRILRHFRATDPRDRIFALLSFATDAAASGLVPDYRKSCAEVYIEATFSVLANGFLDILSLCHQTHRTTAELPSWVPDFSASAAGHGVPLQHRAMDRRGGAVPVTTVLQPRFSASGDVQGRCELVRPSPTEPLLPLLLLQARFVDRVDRTGTAWEQQQHGVQRWLRELRGFSASAEPGHVWRTAVADQEVRQGREKPRMSEGQLGKVHAALAGLDLDLSTSDPQQTLVSSELGDYVYQLQDVARGRRPFCTSGGRIGIGPGGMEKGDLLYVLVGSQVPHILRRDDAHGRMRLVGEAYAHGIMDGEAMEGNPPVDVIALC